MIEYATEPGGRHVDVGEYTYNTEDEKLGVCKSSQATSEVAWCAENSEEKKKTPGPRVEVVHVCQ